MINATIYQDDDSQQLNSHLIMVVYTVQYDVIFLLATTKSEAILQYLLTAILLRHLPNAVAWGTACHTTGCVDLFCYR